MPEAPAPVSQISLIIHTLIIDVVINIDLFYVKVRITNNHYNINILKNNIH